VRYCFARMNAAALFLALLAVDPILPPLPPWNGASRALVVPANDPWVTPSEKTGLKDTPSYDETVAYLRKLVDAAPELEMVSLGKSPEGRDIWLVIASKEKNFTPEKLRRSGKPALFAQGGIHSGEIDGKDAGLMLLRDMTVRGTKRELLDRANFLFVPIFSVDAHERTSRYSRINQRGPEVSGWRTNARNLNLNRDYMKADTEEMRAMIRALDTWDPDLYLDLHVTDGADYQYDITFGFDGPAGHSPAIATWLEQTWRPAMTRALREAGHIPGTLVFPVKDDDVTSGLSERPSDPRFSHAYGDVRHIAAALVENHSLKPYDQRVLGTYVLLENSLRTLGSDGAALRKAIASDRARRVDAVPFAWKVPEGANETIEFLAIESRTHLSPVTGDVYREFTGKPVTLRVPYRRGTEVAGSVTRPTAYWVPASWKDIIDRIALHGIKFERITAPRTIDVEMYRLDEPKYGSEQFEGHVRVTAKTTSERRHETFPAGSIRIPTDQPLGTLAVLLLEPASPDSFFQWGLFDSVLSVTEYVEPYIMEPTAQKMLEADPKLEEEFRAKVANDEAFRANPTERLYWFYRQTPFYDQRARLYPVGRE